MDDDAWHALCHGTSAGTHDPSLRPRGRIASPRATSSTRGSAEWTQSALEGRRGRAPAGARRLGHAGHGPARPPRRPAHARAGRDRDAPPPRGRRRAPHRQPAPLLASPATPRRGRAAHGRRHRSRAHLGARPRRRRGRASSSPTASADEHSPGDRALAEVPPRSQRLRRCAAHLVRAATSRRRGRHRGQRRHPRRDRLLQRDDLLRRRLDRCRRAAPRALRRTDRADRPVRCSPRRRRRARCRSSCSNA